MTATFDRLSAEIQDRYRIEREIGSGGMATVYLAEDIKHHRKVAIKVLHPELSAVLGPDRFLKEIELTANLQHPHILPLFDSGSADGLLYYVMPYVEGETLRDLLSREKQVAIPTAVRIAAEVADALDYAHKRKVIHRDIKPENILLRDGHALVADFGIALAVQQAGGERMTQTGMSLGTPQYMAPEQAMGDKTVDHRADIYALGAVTYEMLAGEPPFTGPTSQAIVAKVITEKPRPLNEVRDTVPRHVAATVTAALQKLPADRPATAGDFAAGLAATSVDRLAEEPKAWGLDRRVAAAAAIALLIAGGLGGFLIRGRSSGSGDSHVIPSRLSILAPSVGGTGPAGLNRQLALTRDGTAIVYVVITSTGQNGLAYQRLDALEPRLVARTDGMLNPVISPDGKSVAGGGGYLFGNRAQSRMMSLASGQFTDMPEGVTLSFSYWAPDGRVWFTPDGVGGLAVLSTDGRVEPKLKGKGLSLLLHQLLDDGKTALMTRTPNGTVSGPAILVNVETGEERPLIDTQIVEIKYTAGYLVYAEPAGTLWAVAFDQRAKRITGTPVQIASGISMTGSGSAQFAVSENGTVAFIPEEPRALVFADRSGNFRSAATELRSYHAPKFSPDGRRISLDVTTAEGRDVWILSLTQGTLSRATFDRDGHDATWTPDGQSITYTTFRKNQIFGLYRVRPGSGAKPESLIVSQKLGYTGVWLPDGSGLVTTMGDTTTASPRQIGLISNGGKGPIVPLVATQFQTQYAALSPDGKWMAFVSNQSGRDEVYVRQVSEGDIVQVSQGGGTEPVWGPDGRELFFRSAGEANVELMSASVTTTPSFEVGVRRKMFGLSDIVAANPHSNYDVSPDGRTFVMVRRSPANRIVIMQNLPQLIAGMRNADTPQN